MAGNPTPVAMASIPTEILRAFRYTVRTYVDKVGLGDISVSLSICPILSILYYLSSEPCSLSLLEKKIII